MDYGDTNHLVTDQCLHGIAVVEQATRSLLGSIARTADTGALDSDAARAGATALAMQLLRETSKAAIPAQQESFQAFVGAARLIEDFTAALAES